MKPQSYQFILLCAVLVMFVMLAVFPQRKSREELIREGPPPTSQEAEVMHVHIIPPNPTVSTATHEIQSSSMVR